MGAPHVGCPRRNMDMVMDWWNAFISRMRKAIMYRSRLKGFGQVAAGNLRQKWLSKPGTKFTKPGLSLLAQP